MFESGFRLHKQMQGALGHNPGLQKALKGANYALSGEIAGRRLADASWLSGVQRQIALWPQIPKVFDQTDRFTATFGQRLSEAIAPVVRWAEVPGTFRTGIPPGISGVLSNLPKLQVFDNFWDSLRHASEGLREMMERMEEGEEILEAAEYGFADHLWNAIYLASFAGYPKQVRHAVVTNRLAAFTRSDGFVEPLLEDVGASRMLGRRSRIIERALEAHQRREYELSVPPLLAQIEGAIADAMFLKNLVVKQGNQYFLAGPDGNLKVNRNNKRLPAITLSVAVRDANLDENPDLEAASRFLSEVLVQRRNDVLHGRDVKYARARFSVQALLVLAVIVEGFEELEER
jgi:hypothetical protein